MTSSKKRGRRSAGGRSIARSLEDVSEGLGVPLEDLELLVSTGRVLAFRSGCGSRLLSLDEARRARMELEMLVSGGGADE